MSNFLFFAILTDSVHKLPGLPNTWKPRTFKVYRRRKGVGNREGGREGGEGDREGGREGGEGDREGGREGGEGDREGGRGRKCLLVCWSTCE